MTEEKMKRKKKERRWSIVGFRHRPTEEDYIDHLETSIECSKDEIKGLKGEAENWSQLVGSCQQTSINQMHKIANLVLLCEEKNQAMQDQNEKIAELDDEKKELDSENKDLQNEIDELKHEHQGLVELAQQRKDKITELEASKERLQKRLAAVPEEIKKIEFLHKTEKKAVADELVGILAVANNTDYFWYYDDEAIIKNSLLDLLKHLKGEE